MVYVFVSEIATTTTKTSWKRLELSTEMFTPCFQFHRIVAQKSIDKYKIYAYTKKCCQTPTKHGHQRETKIDLMPCRA